MQQRNRHNVVQTSTISKPGPFLLLSRILRGAVLEGMQIPALLCIGLTITLYHENIPYHEAISALLISGLILTGLIRGSARWQQDLIGYRRELAISRQQQALSSNDYTIPGFVPFTRR